MEQEPENNYKMGTAMIVSAISVFAIIIFVMSKDDTSTDSKVSINDLKSTENSEVASSVESLPLEDASNDAFVRSNDSNPVVTFKTSMGDISIELYMDKMPITVGNFLKLSESGFYTGTKFHRVIDNFMIQGGDPNSKGDNVGTYGQGGPGYTIEDEFVSGLSNVRGTISMANTGQTNSGGSQFFINYVDNTGLDYDKEPLSSKHPVFGVIIEGQEVADLIIKVETGVADLPLEPVVINEVVISLGKTGE